MCGFLAKVGKVVLSMGVWLRWVRVCVSKWVRECIACCVGIARPMVLMGVRCCILHIMCVCGVCVWVGGCC